MKYHRAFAVAILSLVACAVIASAVYAGRHPLQKPRIVSFGSDSPERGTTRIGYWDTKDNKGVGQFAIDYGRPVWKKDYEDQTKFDAATKGKVYRLGSNFWTTLDTDTPLKISGVPVPVGAWYLGLHRSEDGATWSLAFIDPQKARAAHLDASEIERAPVAFKAPMKLEQATEMREKLTIDLIMKRENLKEAQLRIGWGKLQLTAPVEIPMN